MVAAAAAACEMVGDRVCLTYIGMWSTTLRGGTASRGMYCRSSVRNLAGPEDCCDASLCRGRDASRNYH